MSTLSKYNYCVEVVELKNKIEVAFLTLGEMLYQIRTNSLFEGSWETFADYLEEIKMSESVASRLITVYSKMILEYKISPDLIAKAGGWSNAYEIVKLSKNKEETEKWLEDSSSKMAKDIKIAIREAKTGVSQETCKHYDTYLLRICRKCGDKETVHEEKHEDPITV